MLDTPLAWRRVSNLIATTRTLAPTAAMIMVANVKTGSIDEEDYEETSVSTEYFSSTELSALMAGFREIGFYVTYYGAELDFIRADIAGQLHRSQRPVQLVYNTAQSGTGVGRKALIPAYCNRRGIYVCNSDAYVVSLVRHKFHVHCILKRLGLPTAESWSYWPAIGWTGGIPQSDRRLIAKAAFESSSIGLTRDCVGTYGPDFEETLRRKCEMYQQPFVIQEFVEGYEVEVPVIEIDGMQAVDVVSIALDGSVALGSRAIYYDISERGEYGFSPSDHLGGELRSEIMRIAERVADALGIRGIGRVDFRIDAAGHPYITDVSTSPHLVPDSAVYHAFEWHGYSHPEMLAAMVGANIKRWGIGQDSDQTTMSDSTKPYR